MEATQRCPECGAPSGEGDSCQDRFAQMLAWEWEDPALMDVHHLMVLSYHLQHPSLYSPKGVAYGIALLVDFVEGGVTTEEVRGLNRETLDSGKRGFKIKGTPASHGSYARPVPWTMTAADVISGGMAGYRDNVRAWAQSILQALRASGNLSWPG